MKQKIRNIGAKALLLFALVMGLLLFVADAWAFSVSFGKLVLMGGFCALLSSLCFFGKKSAFWGIPLLLLSVLLLWYVTKTDPLRYIAGGGCFLWNRFMELVDEAGFAALDTVGSSFPQSEQSCALVFSAFSAFILGCANRRRAWLLPSVLYIGAVCGLAFTYSLPEKSIGMTLILAGLAGLCAMRVTEHRAGNITHQGIVGLTAMLLSLTVLAPTAALVRKPLGDLPVLSEQVEYIRRIVTNLAAGRGFTTDSGEAPGPDIAALTRSVFADERSFTGKTVLKVTASTDDTLYLRSWVGSFYRDGVWSCPDTDRVKEYRNFMFTTENQLCKEARYPLFSDTRRVFSRFGEEKALLSSLGIVYSDITVKTVGGGQLLALPVLTEGDIDADCSFEEISDGMLYASRLKKTDAYDLSACLLTARGTDLDEYADSYHAKLADFPGLAAVSDSHNEVVRSLYNDWQQNPVIDRMLLRILEDTPLEALAGTNQRENTISFADGKCVYLLDADKLLDHRDAAAKLLADYLRSHYTYSLDPKTTGIPDPMEEFLFGSGEGYCVQFATALTLMLQRLGIPARYAEGYVADTFSRKGGRFVSDVPDDHGHAWAEVWIDGIGWLPYEATPGFGEELFAPVTEPTTDTEEPGTTPWDTKPPDTTAPVTVGQETKAPPTTAETVPLSTETGIAGKPSAGKNMLPLLLSLLAAALLALLLFFLKKRSDRHLTARKRLFAKARKGEQTGDALCRTLEKMFRAYGLCPGEAELPAAFGSRAEALLGSPGGFSPREAVSAMEQQIYGGYMDKASLTLCAALAAALSDESKKRLGLLRFLFFRYILCVL